jgi:hypothetical protein
MEFVKIFTGKTSAQVENAINETAREGKLDILSVTMTINQGVFYMTVLFRQKKEKNSK